MFNSLSLDIDFVNRTHFANHLAIVSLLVDKGIISHDELKKAKATAAATVEAEFARMREESVQKFDKEHPGVRQAFDDIFGGLVKDDQPTEPGTKD